MASDIICLGGKEIAVSVNDYAFPALLSAMKKENRSIRKGIRKLEKHVDNVDNELAIPLNFNLFDHNHTHR